MHSYYRKKKIGQVTYTKLLHKNFCIKDVNARVTESHNFQETTQCDQPGLMTK